MKCGRNITETNDLKGRSKSFFNDEDMLLLSFSAKNKVKYILIFNFSSAAVDFCVKIYYNID